MTQIELYMTLRDLSQCTYRCVVLPDMTQIELYMTLRDLSQCTYRCVVLPDNSSDDFLRRKS